MQGSWGEAELDSVTGTEDGLTLRETMRAYGLPGSVEGVCRKNDRIKAFL